MLKHNDRNIKEVLQEMIGTNRKINHGYDSVTVQNAWKSEMGEMICRYTEKLKYKDGILTVYLSSAPLRKELSMSKSKVISLLNEAYKADIVTDIVFM